MQLPSRAIFYSLLRFSIPLKTFLKILRFNLFPTLLFSEPITMFNMVSEVRPCMVNVREDARNLLVRVVIHPTIVDHVGNVKTCPNSGGLAKGEKDAKRSNVTNTKTKRRKSRKRSIYYIHMYISRTFKMSFRYFLNEKNYWFNEKK